MAIEKFNEGESAQAFITHIKNLQDQMASTRIQESSKGLAQKYLLICPPKFNGLVSALNTQVRHQPSSFEEFNALL